MPAKELREIIIGRVPLFLNQRLELRTCKAPKSEWASSYV